MLRSIEKYGLEHLLDRRRVSDEAHGHLQPLRRNVADTYKAAPPYLRGESRRASQSALPTMLIALPISLPA